MSRRNRGQFGTIDRALTDHFKTKLLASEILAREHGIRHEPGTRADLCPHCQKQRAAPQGPQPVGEDL